MKKIFTICAAAFLFAACNNNKDLETKKDIIITDTSGMYNNNISTDVAKREEAAPSKAEVKTITKIIYVDRTPGVVKHQRVREATAVQTQPVNTVPNVNTTGTSNTNTKTNTGETNAGTTTGTNDKANTSTTVTPVEKKKGWSNAAKDATIGGVGGAVTGAILSKNKVKGAVIGGILGAAGGYIFGSQKDKKDLADK